MSEFEEEESEIIPPRVEERLYALESRVDALVSIVGDLIVNVGVINGFTISGIEAPQAEAILKEAKETAADLGVLLGRANDQA